MLQSILKVKDYAKILVDDLGATVYYGFTEKPQAATSDGEWSILKEVTVGTVTSYIWADWNGPGGITPKLNWDDRATYTYD